MCYIAKPFKLRNTITTEINKGVTHTFTYLPATADTCSYYTRTDTWGGNTEQQFIIPAYLPGDVIYAMPVSQSVPSYGSVIDAYIINTGSSYATNNVLTIAGGAYAPAATIKVTGVNAGGGITSYYLTGSGKYTVVTPPTPNTPTGGSGTGATFNLNISVWNQLDINADGRAWAH